MKRAWPIFAGLSLLWGSEWLLGASFPEQPVLARLAVRYALTAAFLLPIAVGSRVRRCSWRPLISAVLCGLGILCLPPILIGLAARVLSPALSIGMMAGVPVVLAVAGRLGISTAVLGLAGVLFLAGNGLDIHLPQLPWLLLPLAAAGGLAWSLTAAERCLRDMSPGTLLFVQCMVAAPTLAVVSRILREGPLTLSALAIPGFLLDAGLIGAAGYLIFYWLLARVGAGRSSAIQWAQTLVATAESAALLRIRPSGETVAGALLIVIALVWLFADRSQDGQGVMLQITRE